MAERIDMKTQLLTKRLLLRTVQVTDAPFVAMWKKEHFMRKMSTGIETLITEENQLEDIINSIESEDSLYWIICKDNTPIGYIRINWMDKHQKNAWLRFGLGASRGEGYAYEALSAFINELFINGVYRIDAEVYDFNRNSYKLLKKLHFKEEGIRRHAHFEQGKHYDVYVMGLLVTDFSM